MGAGIGARVDLEKAPLKYKGLRPWEIWLSEAQERMIISVPKKNFEKLVEICEIEGTEATIIGEFTNTKKLELFYSGKEAGSLDMKFLHEGAPVKKLEAEWNSAPENEIECGEPEDYNESLLQILSMPNIASKEKTVRKYDQEVRGGTVGRPFVGSKRDGPADAAIVRPLLDDWAGVVIANGINPMYSDIDTYAMACSVIDEAIRNAVAVGADFERIALLDNFSWANPENPKILGSLVAACEGCHDASKALNVPFISGKDSLYNEYCANGTCTSIPGTLLISSIGIMDDTRRKISMPFKREGNLIYVIGETFSELGGSHYAKFSGVGGGKAPKVDFKKAAKIFSKLSALLSRQKPEQKIVAACHDCSEGGIAVTVAEMAFASTLGAQIHLGSVVLGGKILRDDFILFSESNTRFIVEVELSRKKEFEKAMSGVAFAQIGTVASSGKLVVNGVGKNKIIDSELEEMKAAWKSTLWW